MQRRTFIALLSGAAGWPIAARAQQQAVPAMGGSSLVAPATPRIGFIAPGLPEFGRHIVDALRAGLRAFGWAEGENVALLERWADGETERLPSIAGELIASGVDVLVTAGTAA